jgi:hypothetical protein
MKSYLAQAFGKRGKITVVYAWTWINVENKNSLNYVCKLEGLVKSCWGDHESTREFLGEKVLDISSTNIRILEELTPLTEELY